ncbi:MAG: DUF5117 domain-containing protein [Gammaproteobacteria bacterium]|nr:DUF5117 domain-containing protein [Gammaproteobacteria bacterium]
MNLAKSSVFITLISSLLLSQSVFAEEEKKEDEKKDKEKTVAELIKDQTVYDGFLDFYQDPKTGSLMLTLTDEQFNKPMIYFIHTVNGVLDAGHFKGNYREYKLLEFRKHFDKIEIVSETPRYYLDEKSAISRSAGTNISSATLATMKIEAHDEKTGQYLVKVDPVLLSESIHKVSPYPRTPVPGAPPAPPRFDVGSLSKEKTKYLGVRSYPKNTDVVIEYVFDNPKPSVRGGLEITDARTVSIQMQHSFIEMPDNDYKPRRDDARLGYFTQQVDDLSSESWAPYRDVINRWHLVKKDPSAEISDPVEPIVWWIENTTPIEWRDIIAQATLQWNSAFEKAGFSNAMQVKVQPDDAEWDAGDIRYNVLRWTASPRPPFGGYGPSLPNPLTGQIIAADIMLEYTYMKNRWLAEALYTEGASDDDMLLNMPDGLYCSAGHKMHNSLITAKTILNAAGASSTDLKKLTEQALAGLILHELGHTLGLNHNMRASQQFSPIDIHNADLTKGSITGSVMDYAPLNLAPPGVTQGDYTDSRPGTYDDWVIEYGYSVGLDDPDAEEDRLSAILARSTEADLAFGNDADDMRASGRHIDPRVMIDDMSSDAIAYSEGRIKLVKETFKNLKDKTTHEGESYQELVVGYNSLFGAYVRAINIASRYIAGIYIDRAVVGQAGATQPFTPVSLADQKRAMALMSNYLFAPNVLDEAAPYYNHLQVQRRSFNNFRTNEDPKLHDMILNAQKRILSHLLHKNVLKRMTDSALYGNEYELNEFMSDLTLAVFDADRKSNVTTQRQNLQVEYVNQIIAISGLKGSSGFDHLSKAAATSQLHQIQDKYSSSRKGSKSTKAHRVYISWLIENAFQEKG